MRKIQDWPTCPKCCHLEVTAYGYVHAEVCDYLTFRDVTAPQIKWSLIPNSESRYVKVIFDVHGIDYRAFKVSSISGYYLELFAPDHIVAAVNLYYSAAEAYGGMDLAEYLEAITATC